MNSELGDPRIGERRRFVVGEPELEVGGRRGGRLDGRRGQAGQRQTGREDGERRLFGGAEHGYAFNNGVSRSERCPSADPPAPASAPPPAASIRSSSSRAPALESGSLRLPHFGDWMHEGQPEAQVHSAIRRYASRQSSSKRAKAVRVMPIPPGCPS